MEPVNENFHITEEERDFLMMQYQVLSGRELNHDTMLWNVPTLLFVAQSLLWSIALDSDVNPVFRCIISLSSALICFMSFQMFWRARLMEVADAEQLFSIEEFLAKHQKGAFVPVLIHHKLNKRTVLSENGSKPLTEVLDKNPAFSRNPLSKLSSFTIWECIFWIFFGISALIFGYNLVICIHQVIVG